MPSKSSSRFLLPVAVLSAFGLVASCGDSFSVAFDPQRSLGGQGGAAGGSSEPSSGGGGKSGGSGGRKGAGGGSAGATAVALSLVDAEVPPGAFNADYEHVFEVENARGDVTFEVVSGALPRGLSLSEEGKLSGVPTEAGEFEFTLGASDERGGELEVSLTLEVRRKRWMAYATNGEADGGLLLVDVTKAEPTSTRVSPAAVTVVDVRFSPRGDWLAFTATAEGEYTPRLFLVDLSVEDSPVGEIVSSLVRASTFAWSPDGRYLAYTDSRSQSEQTVYLHDFDAPQEVPLNVGAGSVSRWLGSTLVFNTYDPANGTTSVRYVTVENGEASVIRQIEGTDLAISVVAPTGKKASLATLIGGLACSASESSSWVDFERGVRTVGPSGPTRYSPDLRYVASLSGSTFRLLPTEDFASATPLATGRPGTGCDGIWSPDSLWFVIVNGDGQLEVLSSEGSANQVLAPTNVNWPAWRGGGVPPEGHPLAGFSPDGRWFRFRGSSRAQLSRVTRAGFGAPRAMTVDRNSIASWISPSSKLYVVWEEAGDGTTALRLFDISGDAPNAGRELVSWPPSTGVGVERGSEFPAPLPRFSSDSSLLAYRVQDKSTDPTDLYLVDLLDEGAEGKNVSRLKCGSTTCSVQHVVFQP